MPDPKHIIDSVDAEAMLSDDATPQDGLPVVAAYIRSARPNATGANSLSVQKQKIVAACGQHFPNGCHVVVYEEHGVTRHGPAQAAVPATLREVLESAAAGTIQYVCAVSPDRVSNDVRVYMAFLAGLDQAAVEMLFVREDGGLNPIDDSVSATIATAVSHLLSRRFGRAAIYHRTSRSGSAE